MSIKGDYESGLSLIELIMFIVIVSVGVVGVVSVMNPMMRNSADPMQTKQLAAIAESLLSEALHQPFTWCDPDDPSASVATSYADCALPQNTLTTVPVGGESRNGGAGTSFDNVSDYGVGLVAVADVAGVSPLAGYVAKIEVANAGVAMGLADDTAALSVTVTVNQGTDSFVLTGYRFRYAPRT